MLLDQRQDLQEDVISVLTLGLDDVEDGGHGREGQRVSVMRRGWEGCREVLAHPGPESPRVGRLVDKMDEGIVRSQKL